MFKNTKLFENIIIFEIALDLKEEFVNICSALRIVEDNKLYVKTSIQKPKAYL